VAQRELRMIDPVERPKRPSRDGETFAAPAGRDDSPDGGG